MYTFTNQMNWQFVQIFMDSKFHSKLRVLGTDDVKQKTSLFSVQRKSAWYCFKAVFFFVLRHLCPVLKRNPQSPITIILTTYLLHELIVNVKHRMDWSYRKPYICLSFNFWKQYLADGICLSSVNMQKYVDLPLTSLRESNFPWLILKFPDLINCPLWVKELIFLEL